MADALVAADGESVWRMVEMCLCTLWGAVCRTLGGCKERLLQGDAGPKVRVWGG